MYEQGNVSVLVVFLLLWCLAMVALTALVSKSLNYRLKLLHEEQAKTKELLESALEQIKEMEGDYG